LIEQTLSKPKPLSVHMVSFGNSRSTSGMVALTRSPARQASAISGAIPAFGPALPGTGFETLPPLAISTNLFKFLKGMGLDSVGLGLDCVPFHSGWELVK